MAAQEEGVEEYVCFPGGMENATLEWWTPFSSPQLVQEAETPGLVNSNYVSPTAE